MPIFVVIDRAVAAEAGVSKGGLLYHFHAKDDLLQAMIQRMIQAYRSRLDAALANSDPAPGSFTHACINALSDLPPAEQARFQRLSSALLAAVTADPRLLDPLRTLYRELFSRIATDGSAIQVPPLALDLSTFLVQTRNGGVFAISIQ